MLALLGCAFELSAPSPLTKAGRSYEAFLRPPATLWNGAWGTVDAYRYRIEHTASISAWPNPTDAQTQDFGVVDTTVSTVSIAEPAEGKLITAPDNTAVRFDGLDDQIQVGAVAALSNVPTFTIEAWIAHDPSVASCGIFEKTIGGAVNTSFGLLIEGGNLKLRVKRSVAGTLQDLPVAIAPLENAAHHVAGSYDGQVMRLYVDGVQVNSFDMGAPTAIAVGLGICTIGFGGGNGYLFKGVIDEVRLWSVARAAGDIADNMYRRLSGKERNLIGYWPLDDGAGLVATDKSPTAANGAVAGGAAWTTGVPMDARYEFFKLQAKLRDQLVDLELVTRIFREDGTFVELVSERRCTVKKVTRKPGVLALDIADVDRSALDALYPSKTYNTTDWPELFKDHVNRPVPQGVGTVEKVPLTWVVKTGGVWKYAVCEIAPGTGTPTVLTVYRDKKVVSAVEYSTATQVINGVTHFLITFTKEQIDTSGNVYTLEADMQYSGSRLASDEVKRLLLLTSATVDAPSFDAAAANCIKYGLYVDVPYSTQSTFLKCIQDALVVCRAQLFKTPAGTWRIFMDVPRDVAMMATAKNDELWVDEFSYPEIPKTVTLMYRMSSNADGGLELMGKLSRTTNGTGKEEVWSNPAIRDHVVADRVLCYLTKRRQNRADAKGYVVGQQLDVGDLVALEAPNSWADRKVLAAPSVQRSPDRNDLVMSEYVEDTYVYTPGTLPTDATTGYKPDYSQTAPGDPSGAVITQNVTFEAVYSWQSAVDPGNRALLYIVEDNASGSFVEVFRGTVTSYQRTGLAAAGSVRFRVKAAVVENTALQSNYATSAPFTLAATINDSFVPGGGLTGASIANGAINRARSYTGTGSVSVTVTTGTIGTLTMDYYTFAPSVSSNLGNLNLAAPAVAFADDQGHVSARNTSGANDILSAQWRNFLT